MEENKRENNLNEEKISPNNEDEIIVKDRDTRLRGKKVSQPDYEYTINPMNPNVDGKNGLFFKTLFVSSKIGVVLFIIAAIAFFVFLFWVARASFSAPLSFNKKLPDAILNLSTKYGESFSTKDFSTASQKEYKEYTAYPTENKKIVFTVSESSKYGHSIFSDDYLTKAYEYYIDDYKGDLSGISISLDESSPSIILETTFENLDTELKKLYDLKQFLISKTVAFEKMLFTLKLEHYYENGKSGQYITSETTLDEFILMEKNFYILFLEENNFDLAEVPESDLDNYRPKTLKVNLSYKKIPEKTLTATYDFEKQDYIIDMSILLNFMKNIEYINKEELHFYFNETELKVNKEMSLEEIEDTFNASIILNIKGKSLTIYHD